ncbi:MAG: mechanosensitive ion channel [Inhella sp.]|nr:mechanosensitive ion channel [Inhella sp.]
MNFDLHLVQQALLLLACLLGAWAPVALLRRRFAAAEESVWLGRRVIDGVLFPMLALLLTWVALRGMLHAGLGVQLLRMALPILSSLLLIRLVVRVLRLALPQSGWAHAAERWVSWLAWGGSILWISGLWPAAWAELEAIEWKLGGVHISLATLLEAAFNVVLVLVVTLWLSAAIESRLLQRATDDLSARKIVANLVKALLLLIGLLLALSGAGIDLTALGVLGGALGVGVGLGLQKLASNYVSGFVILAERSLRIGDVVKVDGFEGRISDIKTRYTVIRAVNGRESIVPNELLITQRVENSSLADTRVAQTTTVSVGYETDLERLFPLLAAAVAAVPRVQQDPGPALQLSNFGADGLELTLVYWIADPENGTGNVRSEVNLAVLALLRREQVTIPYPQRVVHPA